MVVEGGMDALTGTVLDFVLREGAAASGSATTETLEGGPPSTDLRYVLPGARSAVSFAVPLDPDLIEPYLAKRERLAHERDNLRANAVASGIAKHLAGYLEQKGYPSFPIASNNIYRDDTPGGRLDMLPDISLRYLAVRSGVGSFGLSGNVLLAEYGASVILGGVVTTAALVPTAPLPPDAGYCDACRICLAACASGMMDPKEKTRVSLGGLEFTYARRRDYLRCEFVCGGMTGLHPSGQWSTWSPGRFTIPEKNEAFRAAMARGIQAYNRRPPLEGGYYHPLMKERLQFTCGNCQLVCHPEKHVRKRRLDLLRSSGVVVQSEDGSLSVFSPEEASHRLHAMAPPRRSLYEDS